MKKFLINSVISISLIALMGYTHNATGTGEYRAYLPSIIQSPSKKCAATSILYFINPISATQQLKDLGVNCSYLYTQANSWTEESIDMAGTIAWSDPATTPIGGTSDYFLGWNEPDLNPQVTLTQAAIRWKTVVDSNPTLIPVSPGPSHLHPEWLSQWRTKYIQTWGSPPVLGALAIHCYLSTPNPDCVSVISQVITYAEAWNVPEVWVTEFGASPEWTTNWQAQAQTLIDWMEEQPGVTRYYWWAVSYPSNNPCCPWGTGFYTQLFDWESGEITELGEFYRDYLNW